VLSTLWTPAFLSYRNIVNIASQSSVLLLVSLGSAFVIVMGSIDLSVGATASLSGIVAAELAGQFGPWALAAGVLVGLAAGALNGLLLTVLRIPSFLTTLGTMSLMTGLALIITQGVPVSISDPAFMGLANSRVAFTVPLLVFWSSAAYVICLVVGARTRFGRYIYAIGGGEQVAIISGVPVNRYKVYAFIVSGGLAALGGGLLAGWLQTGAPGAGSGYMLGAITAVVMGGIPLTGGFGSIGRTLLGVLVIGVLSNGLNLAGIGPYVQTVIQGIVVIVAVAFSLDRSKLSILK
jgi:ribose transport system permease protein/putative xylitol transport system permease protein